MFTRSFWLALLATVICLLIGYPAAYMISKEGPRFQRIAMMLIMLPMWMNFLLRTYSWMSILENTGLLNRLFAANKQGHPSHIGHGKEGALILHFRPPRLPPEGSQVDVVIRPEDIDIVPAEKGQLRGTVASVTFKGVHYDTIVDFKGT